MSHTPGPWEWRRVGKDWVLWRAAADRPIVLNFVRDGMQGAAPRVNIAGVMHRFDPEHPDAKLIASAPALKARVAELEAVLRDNEWVRDLEQDFLYCNECGETKRSGHDAACRLGRLAAAIKGEEANDG